MLALPFVPALLAKRWDEPQFPDWSQDFIDRMVTDSPWARPFKATIVKPFDPKVVSSFMQIGIGLPNPLPGGWPGGSTGGRSPRGTPGPGMPTGDSSPILRIAVDLTIRWASALPVRRAFALQEFSRSGLDHPRAIELLETEPTDFLIQIAGIPRTLYGEDGKHLRNQLQETRLSIPGRRTLTPARIDIPSIGRELTATLRFPRSSVPEDAASIELLSQIESERIEQRFKVRSMHYQDRLEL